VIVQPPTAPVRVPVASSVIPVQFAEPSANLAAQRAAWEVEYARIPAVIRAEMEQWYLYGGVRLTRLTYRFGSATWLADGPGAWIGWASNYAGLYDSATVGGADAIFHNHKIACATNYRDGASAIVHEFGHHIDAVLTYLRGTPWGPLSALNYGTPFAETWAARHAQIPSAYYGATNIREWMAEQWRCIIQGDPATFKQLMGGDAPTATAIYAHWVTLFPSLAGRLAL
jgi:hypothetical protein